MTSGDRTTLKISHWHANGFRCRKAALQQHLRSLTAPDLPDVIMVQETNAEDANATSLQGYRAHTSSPSARACGKGAARGVCTFVRKGIAFVKHENFLGGRGSSIEHCATELAIVTSRRKKRATGTDVLVVNVYSNPQHCQQKFRVLLHKARIAVSGQRDAPVVVCGDFNAQHRELGHTATSAKGRSLLEDAAEAGYVLLTDLSHPTRIGTSTVRDTNPDLSFALLPGGRTAQWRNTVHNLGSDHYIVDGTVPLRSGDEGDGGGAGRVES